MSWSSSDVYMFLDCMRAGAHLRPLYVAHTTPTHRSNIEKFYQSFLTVRTDQERRQRKEDSIRRAEEQAKHQVQSPAVSKTEQCPPTVPVPVHQSVPVERGPPAVPVHEPVPVTPAPTAMSASPSVPLSVHRPRPTVPVHQSVPVERGPLAVPVHEPVPVAQVPTAVSASPP